MAKHSQQDPATGSTPRRNRYTFTRRGDNGRDPHPENLPETHAAPDRRPPKWSPTIHYEVLDSGAYYAMGALEKNLYMAMLRWASKDTGELHPKQEDQAAPSDACGGGATGDEESESRAVRNVSVVGARRP